MGLISAVGKWGQILKTLHSGRDYIESLKQQKLRRILIHAAANSEFYQDLYQGIDLQDCRLQDLPIVTKAAMMDNYDRFVTDKRLKLQEIRHWVNDERNEGKFYLGEFGPFLTSGSTGENALIMYHKKALDHIHASFFAYYPYQPKHLIASHIRKIAGYVASKRPRVALLTVPKSNTEQLFKRVPRHHRYFVHMKIYSLLDPLDQIVEDLNRFKPDQILTLSFFIAILAQEQLSGRLKLAFNHPMAFITGGGEVLSEHTRELAAKAWNMEVMSTYGTMECYLMATSCGINNHLHLMGNLCIVEIVDRRYEPVPPGQYGEKILLTNLFNDTQPIIRYEIDDSVAYAEQRCECGSPFPALLPVQGRAQDFLYFHTARGGYAEFPPRLLTISLMYVHELRQYQVVQTARNELTFTYVSRNDAFGIEQKLKRVLTKALAQKGLEDLVSLRFKKVESISRNERSGKYRPIISLGPPGDSAIPGR